MNVHIERSGEERELRYSGSAKDLCSQLDVNPETVLIIRNGALVTEDEGLSDDDTIQLLTVVSGG